MIRKYFLLTLILLCVLPAFAVTDLGTIKSFTISGKRTTDSAVDSSAAVFTVTSQDIEKYHYESTSDAISSIGAASINSVGALGSLQNANVNGMGSSRTLVYIDGTQVSTSYDNSFDLNAIPVSAIEKIEIITSGSGKNSKNLAAGGVINIITKRPQESPFLSVSFENGSFLPAKKGIEALIDSQDFHVNYSDSIGSQHFFVSIGGMRAANGYSFTDKKHGINNLTLRKNAETWAADASVNVSGKIDDVKYSSNNLFRYQHLGVPGSSTWPTEKDCQNNLLLNSSTRFEKNRFYVNFNYAYNPVLIYYSDYDKTESSHHKHNLSAKAEYAYEVNEDINVTSYAETSLEIARSTSLDETQLRFYPRIGFNSSVSFGNLVLYPVADIGYTTDMKKWFANASVGSDYAIAKKLNLTGNLSFAHRLPTFSDLYAPFKDYGYMTYQGNPNLKPEKALSADIGLSFNSSILNVSFDYFTRWVNDLILTTADYSSMENLDDALYLGFNTNAGVTLNNFNANIGWLYNRSYNLTNGNSMKDDKRINNVRLNTLTFSASYRFNKVIITTDGKYLGKYESEGKKYDGAFVLNASLEYSASEKLSAYLKIDNVLNNQYQLSDGYPMPGMKVRIGGTWRMK